MDKETVEVEEKKAGKNPSKKLKLNKKKVVAALATMKKKWM